MTPVARKVHKLFDKGYKDYVWDMISGKCNVNPDVLDKDGRTMLHKAIGDVSTIKALIAAGASPNIPVRRLSCRRFVEE